MSNQLAIIKQEMPAIQKKFQAVPNCNLDFAREAGFAMQVLQANSFLANTDINSIKNAIVNVALTGLSLNPVTKFAYLVPRAGKCVLDVSYMGLCKILTDAGAIKSVYARVVYVKDHFQLVEGSDPKLVHLPYLDSHPGDMKGIYSMAILQDGTRLWDYMRKDQIDAIMNRSEMGKQGKGSWKTDYEEMAKKTVIKRHYKTLPKSGINPDLLAALELDNQTNGIDFKTEQQKETKSKMDSIIEDVEPNVEQELTHEEADSALANEKGN